MLAYDEDFLRQAIAQAVNGPLLPDEGLAVFAGFDFTPKRERQ
jgi:hypothetical protein